MMTAARAASFEESFNNKVLTHGRILVNQLAIFVKVAQMHDLRNEAVTHAADALAGTLRIFFEERKHFSLILIGDYLFIEDIRVKYNVEDFNNFDFLVTEFKKRKLGSLNFNSTLEPDELVAFVSIFLSTELSSEEVYAELARRLSGAGLSGISTDELRPPRAEDSFEKVLDREKAATKAYIRVVLRVRELYEGVGRGNPADIRKMKRAVQALVDSAYKAEDTLIRLASIRRPDDILPRHYANVCVLSLGIGKRLGLSKYQMARLGMAALLHDMGRQTLPEDLFSGGEEYEETAVELIRRHPRLGVQALLKLKGLNEVAVSAMIVAYEHHRNLDGTGYPDVIEPKEMNLFSKVVRIADNYDASTSSGIYGRVAALPEKAVSLMAKRAGSYYDPDILGLFAAMMGRYPIGSLVQLSDGRAGVVVAPGGAPDRPLVRLLGGPREAAVLDLAVEGAPGISRALDPARFGLNVYKYLF